MVESLRAKVVCGNIIKNVIFFEQSGVFSVSKVSKKVSKDFQKFPDDKEEDIDKKLKQIQLENELLKQQN